MASAGALMLSVCTPAVTLAQSAPAYNGQTLTNASFSGQELRGASFNDADLTNADLSGAQLQSASMSGAHTRRNREGGPIPLGTDRPTPGPMRLTALPEG